MHHIKHTNCVCEQASCVDDDESDVARLHRHQCVRRCARVHLGRLWEAAAPNRHRFYCVVGCRSVELWCSSLVWSFYSRSTSVCRIERSRQDYYDGMPKKKKNKKPNGKQRIYFFTSPSHRTHHRSPQRFRIVRFVFTSRSLDADGLNPCTSRAAKKELWWVMMTIIIIIGKLRNDVLYLREIARSKRTNDAQRISGWWMGTVSASVLIIFFFSH